MVIYRCQTASPVSLFVGFPPPEEEPTAEMFTVKQLYNLFSQVRLSSTFFVYKIKLFLFQKMFENPSLHDVYSTASCLLYKK
jgi:hypothetical protein